MAVKRKGLNLGAVRLGKIWLKVLVLLIVGGGIVAIGGADPDYDDKSIQRAEEQILTTGDYMLKTAQMVGALEYYNLTAAYNNASIFDSYSELKLNYTALIWKFMDFKDYDIYAPDEAYSLAIEMKSEAEKIGDVAEESLHEANYSKGTIHEGRVLVMGGMWLSKYTAAFIAAFEGYSPTVAEDTDLKGEYEPDKYDIIVLNDYMNDYEGALGISSYRNWKRLERLLGSDEIGIVFMRGAMAPNVWNANVGGVFSQLFPNSFENGIYVFSANYTLKTDPSSPPEFEDLASTWDMSGWGAWTFNLSSDELENQEVILNLEWPEYNFYNNPVYGKPIAIAFTYRDTKIIASGLRSYLVKPWGEPEEREPVEWLYESPDYEEFLTASLEHVAPSE